MSLLQFAFGNDPQGPSLRPHNYSRELVAYTGGHDNDTPRLVGGRVRGSGKVLEPPRSSAKNGVSPGHNLGFKISRSIGYSSHRFGVVGEHRHCLLARCVESVPDRFMRASLPRLNTSCQETMA